jgi:hydrogenase-4 component B
MQLSANDLLLLAPLLCLLAGAIVSMVFRARTSYCLTWGYGAAAVAGLLATVAGALSLAGTSAATTVQLWTILPGTSMALHLAPLGAAFWIVIGVPVFAVSIYASGYARHYATDDAGGRPHQAVPRQVEGSPAAGHRAEGDPHGERPLRAGYSLGALGTVFNLFVAALLLVVSATDALGFLVAWEAMAVLSYLLVVYEHHDRGVVRAGLIYAVMTHAGTACLVVCFLILGSAAPGRALGFAALARAGQHLDPRTAALVFLLALLGFGTKAGVMPLHIWLPRAHPVAPSHVSALMSGVMIKTGIYGLVLVWFAFLPPGPLWWGLLVLGLGAVSAFLGVLYALMQHDLKRLLAYHSVENIGIILLALGAALILRTNAQPALAALALVAALFHTLNHAVFKSLLFMGAGAVQSATHTRELERLGGLIHRMPWTAACFLVGAVAIAALPPFNGFASEWLVYQVLIAVGVHGGAPGVGGGALLAGSALGLTGALAAACFVKAVGIPFLGLPRGRGAAEAGEAGRPERAGMAILAVACLILGLLPLIVLRALRPLTLSLVGTAPDGSSGGLAGTLGAVTVPGMTARTAWHPLALSLALAGLAILAIVLVRGPARTWFSSRASTPAGPGPLAFPPRVSETWNCGMALTPRMQYSATSFAQPIRRMFSAIVWPERTQEVRYTHAPYFVEAISYHVSLKPLFRRLLYAPVQRAVLRGVSVVRLVQNGSVHAYLTYVFVALLIVLAVVR